MTNNSNDGKQKNSLTNLSNTGLQDNHKLFLEALRHREQEILQFLAILVPALGGFGWLLRLDCRQACPSNFVIFPAGTIGILLLLLLGAVYSLALGYNFRVITLQQAKLEKCMGITHATLKRWPRTPEEFINRYKCCCHIPWCTPPEIIKFFWMAFILGIIGVTLTASLSNHGAKVLATVIPFGSVSFLIGLLLPIIFGYKLKEICEDEKKDPIWNHPSGRGGANNATET